MQTAFPFLAEYALLLVFLNVLLTEGGLPLPVYPTLAGASAAVSAQGGHLTAIILAGVAGSVIADSGWYFTGRQVGHTILGRLCKLSLSPESCVRQTHSLFTRFGAASLLFAKFFPGLTTITVSLAAITGTPFLLFLLLDAIGAALFVGVPVGLGYLFRDAVADVLAVITRLGAVGIIGVLVAFGLYAAMRWWQRTSFIKKLKMDRISVAELAELIAKGEQPLILDVRDPRARRSYGIIPGALAAHPVDIKSTLHKMPRNREVVIYCACPSEASAAIACRHLQRSGFKRIRPLAGGIEAWAAAGHPIEAIVAV